MTIMMNWCLPSCKTCNSLSECPDHFVSETIQFRENADQDSFRLKSYFFLNKLSPLDSAFCAQLCFTALVSLQEEHVEQTRLTYKSEKRKCSKTQLVKIVLMKLVPSFIQVHSVFAEDLTLFVIDKVKPQ